MKEKVTKCAECKTQLFQDFFAPKWMLGKKFCDYNCADKNFEKHKNKLSSDIDKILNKAK